MKKRLAEVVKKCKGCAARRAAMRAFAQKFKRQVKGKPNGKTS